MANDDIHKTEDKITKEVTAERTSAASDSVEHLINLIRMKRTMQLRKQKTDELKKTAIDSIERGKQALKAPLET